MMASSHDVDGSYGPDGGEEVPLWKPQLSFRGQPYRYVHHQNGVMGHLQVRKCVNAQQYSDGDAAARWCIDARGNNPGGKS